MIGLCLGLPGLSNYGFGIFIAPLSREFGWPVSALSAWPFFLMMGSCLSSIWLGRLADRFGARRIILSAMPLFAIALAAAATLTGGLWQLRAIALAAGAIGPGVSLLAYGQAINERFSLSRGTALGLMTAGIGFSSVVAAPLMQWVVDGRGWRFGFVFMGSTALLAWPFAWFWLTEPRGLHRRSASPQLSSGLNTQAALRMPSFWLINLIALVVGLYANGVIFNLLPLLTEGGLSRAQGASYLAFFGLFMVMGKLLCGITLDRLAVNRVAASILVLQALALMLLGVSSGALLAAAIAAIGFGTGAQITCSTYTIPRYLGMKAYGQVYGIVSVVGSIGVAVGPYLFSRLRELTETYRTPELAAGGLALCAAVLYGALGRGAPRQQVRTTPL
jgi:predicted MFS family arabinose efflux permease